MIKAVFFDFYNTLAYFWPPVQVIQAVACREVGLFVEEEGILRGYAEADKVFSRENHARPLYLRSEEDRNRFFSRYEQIILKGAGLDVSPALAESVWRVGASVPKSFALFDDVAPVLSQLKAKGIATGVLSNLAEDLEPLVEGLGIAANLDALVTSIEVGAEKPDPRMFNAALERVGARPEEAVHVGDQYHSDVQGARGGGYELCDAGQRRVERFRCRLCAGGEPIGNRRLAGGWRLRLAPLGLASKAADGQAGQPFLKLLQPL